MTATATDLRSLHQSLVEEESKVSNTISPLLAEKAKLEREIEDLQSKIEDANELIGVLRKSIGVATSPLRERIKEYNRLRNQAWLDQKEASGLAWCTLGKCFKPITDWGIRHFLAVYQIEPPDRDDPYTYSYNLHQSPDKEAYLKNLGDLDFRVHMCVPVVVTTGDNPRLFRDDTPEHLSAAKGVAARFIHSLPDVDKTHRQLPEVSDEEAVECGIPPKLKVPSM